MNRKGAFFPLINIFPVEQMRESQKKHSWAISPPWERHFQALCAYLITKNYFDKHFPVGIKTHAWFQPSFQPLILSYLKRTLERN